MRQSINKVDFNSLPSDFQAVLKNTKSYLKNAYAPYSNFNVAAAVIDSVGDIYYGVNIENMSFGMTICAEIAAISGYQTNSAGSIIKAVFVIGGKRIKGNSWQDTGIVAPCGRCRQVISEFSREKDSAISVFASNYSLTNIISGSIHDFLPVSFNFIDTVDKKFP